VKDGHFDWESTDAEYAAAFREYGLDVDELDPQLAAEQIRGRPIHSQLVAALDDWALIGRRLKAEGWKQRLAVARAVDPDVVRDRLRDVLEAKDRKTLEEVVAAGPVGDWPAPTLELLARLARRTPSGERVAALLRQAQQRHPDDFWINHTLGYSLQHSRPARLEEAIRYYSIAVALRPGSPGTHLNLSGVLHLKGQLDAAIAECREAIRLKNDYAEAHSDLGYALRDNGQLNEAIAEYREAILLKKDLFEAHNNLGVALAEKGKLEEAITEYREAISLNPDLAGAHCGLGIALAAKDQLDEAIVEYHKAIHIDPKYSAPHYTLANALVLKDQLNDAVAEYRLAIGLKEDYAEAHCNYGNVLMKQGQFRQAVEEFRRGHELGSKNPRWAYPSAQWVRKAEQLVALEGKLPKLLNGEAQPADAGERMALAHLCQEHKKRYAAAARFFAEGFAAQPGLADDLRASHRYNAACVAALAGCGQGKDADKIDTKERAGLRKQGLDWLRADLTAWRNVLEKNKDKAAPVVLRQMRHWLGDTDFNGVRGAEALAKLPQAERGDWQKLWEEVEALRQRAAKPAEPASAARP